ncbi:MAG TPA: hypothetical protein DEA82_08155 [Flavobacteriaceae bacterium]|nr:hypothetical protein [Flavobacteriaceae bacterium]
MSSADDGFGDVVLIPTCALMTIEKNSTQLPSRDFLFNIVMSFISLNFVFTKLPYATLYGSVSILVLILLLF